MTTAPGFQAENYQRLRAYLLTMPQFDWLVPNQLTPTDPGCVACACMRIENPAVGTVTTDYLDIQRVLGCTVGEAMDLYMPQSANCWDARAAVRRLDAVAQNYGVTPESAPAPAESFTVTLQPEADFIAELRQFAAEVRKELETR